MTDRQKVTLVTGRARGIGRAISLAFAADHRVAVTCLKSAGDDLPPEVLKIRADLKTPDAFQTIIDEVVGTFGALDTLVNNAGALEPSPLDGASTETLRANWDVNLLAPHGLLLAALPHLSAGASIVSISSVNAILPPKGAALYGASKAALDLWTRAMAKELGPRGIRVNAVAPGAVNIPEAPRDADLTEKFIEMTALGRLATPEDIAQAVRFLASDAARSITGEILTVSGGYRL